MSDQIALSGFEEASAKEQAVYDEIAPMLRSAAEAMGADPAKVRFKPLTNYSSVYYDTTLAFRLRLRGSVHYIEVPLSSRPTVLQLAPPEKQAAVGDFWRIKCKSSEMVQHGEIFAEVLRDAINRIPKSWDCCSRYLECSDAKRCVHPDPSTALGCGYRKILASGRIFYGPNRNID